jgi:hypothetical protein
VTDEVKVMRWCMRLIEQGTVAVYGEDGSEERRHTDGALKRALFFFSHVPSFLGTEFIGKAYNISL